MPQTNCPLVSGDANDQFVQRTSTSYATIASGTFSRSSVSGQPVVTAGRFRNFFGEFFVQNILAAFDTSSVPSGATITSANLEIFVPSGGIANDDARSLTAGYYAWDGTSTSDWTNTPETTAVAGTVLSSIPTNTVTSIALGGLSSINKGTSAVTKLRFSISGGQPTGFNQITIADSANTAGQAPMRLVVNYSIIVASADAQGETTNEAPGPVKLVTLPRQGDTPLTATADKVVNKNASATTSNTGTLSTLVLLNENRQGKAVRRDAQGRLFVNPDYLTGARRDAEGRAYINPDATGLAPAAVARVDTEGRGYIQYDFWGAISTASTSPDASAQKMALLNASSSTTSEGAASKLVSPGALQAATSCEAAFFDAFKASIMILVGETVCEASTARLINKIADAGTACEASASKLVSRTLDAATAAVGSAARLVTKNATAETANPATATKVVQLKPLASTACVGSAIKLVLTGIKLATTDSTGILLGGVQAVKSLVFTLGSYLAGKRGSIEPRVNLFLSNIRGDEIEPITTGESMSVNLANGRDHTWELAVRMAHTDVFDPLTDIVKPTLDYWNGESWDRFPLGLYRMSHPNEENLEHIRFWNLKGQSLESLLAEDMAPGSYSVPKNAGVLLEVKTILRTVFEVPDEAINFPAANEEVLLASPMFFDVATATEQCYWLPICNSLLAAAGFTPLQTDARGRFYTRKYQDPNIRQPDIRYGMGGDEIINAESAINIDRDASEFANRVIVISNDTTVAPIAAIAANHNPQSPYSIENLRKTVTKTVTLQNVVSSAEASLMAQVELARRSGIFEKLSFQTAPDPRRGPAEVLELYIEDENGDPVISGLWMYEGWSMNLEPLSLQDHTAGRITVI